MSIATITLPADFLAAAGELIRFDFTQPVQLDVLQRRLARDSGA
jgi:hypothetical protein